MIGDGVPSATIRPPLLPALRRVSPGPVDAMAQPAALLLQGHRAPMATDDLPEPEMHWHHQHRKL